MQLLSLTVDNVGVFRGRHRLDFYPVRTVDGTSRNLTIVRGENGAGKSTLFKALGLALHGSLYLGSRVSRQAYNSFLLNRLHRSDDSDQTTTSGEGGVELSFSHVRSGQPSVVEVKRRWVRSDKRVAEALEVYQDGEPPEVESSDYQTYLNDLIPSGVSPLCFFDAEVLGALTPSQQRDSTPFGETLRCLLGLDLVDCLQNDLAQYTTRQGGGKKIERLREQIREHQKAIEELDSLVEQLDSDADSLEGERAELETALESQERKLASEGGTYAARRSMLQERQTAIGEEIESVSEQLRELSSGLLPFALIPGLCRTLADNLTREAKLHRQNVAGELLQERTSSVESVLQGDEVWQGLDLPEEARNVITRRVSELLRTADSTVDSNGHHPVHRLAEPEHDRLQGWIAQALHFAPQQAKALGERLREIKQERRRIEKDLQRVPQDETLAPIHAEMERSQEGLEDVQRRQKELSERLGALRFQSEDRKSQLERADAELRELQSGERQMDLAERSKRVLRSYQDALTRQRLKALENSLVESFNTICHKDQLLSTASINPQNFEVQPENVSGRAVRVEDFSAGEQQLYALALLRALRHVSKRPLPLAIDTPVSRLDEAHRDRFIHRYVPEVSDQVILFATDVEMDSEILKQTGPYLARIYHLDHDEKRGETQITASDQTINDHSDPVFAVNMPAKGQGDADL